MIKIGCRMCDSLNIHTNPLTGEPICMHCGSHDIYYEEIKEMKHIVITPPGMYDQFGNKLE